MKKSIFAMALVMMLLVTTPAMACVDFGYEDYCGYQYHCYQQDYTQMQPRFCQYCGAETWACSCGYYGQQSYQQGYGYGYQQSYQCQAYDYGYQDQSCGYGYQDQSYGCDQSSYDYGYQDQSYVSQDQSYDCNYNQGYQDQTCGYSQSYSCGSAVMAQWANVRDDCGNIIGSANAGDSIDIYGTCGWDCSRTLIYDYTTGVYGSVLTDCIYGNYVWDGGCSQDYSYQDNYQDCSYDTGYTDTGYVDQASYQSDYQDCNYNYSDSGVSCNNYTVMRYEEYRSWTAISQSSCGQTFSQKYGKCGSPCFAK